MNTKSLQAVYEILSQGNVVALTGAGISEESGVPTFRGEGGIWNKYNPTVYANPVGLIFTFITRPHRVSNFITEIYETLLNAEPNAAHVALAELERMGILSAVITQNIDNLHQKAGSTNVIELHGNMLRFRCTKCGKRYVLNEQEIESLLRLLRSSSRLALIKTLFPKCNCGGRKRPDVVLFGESLPTDEIERAYTEISKCDALLIIGTSGVVYPAASLPYYAKQRDAKIIEINPEGTPFSTISDYVLLGKAGDLLPEIVERFL